MWLTRVERVPQRVKVTKSQSLVSMARYSKKMKGPKLLLLLILAKLPEERKPMDRTRAIKLILRIMENSQGQAGRTRIFIYKSGLRDIMAKLRGKMAYKIKNSFTACILSSMKFASE